MELNGLKFRFEWLEIWIWNHRSPPWIFSNFLFKKLWNWSNIVFVSYFQSTYLLHKIFEVLKYYTILFLCVRISSYKYTYSKIYHLFYPRSEIPLNCLIRNVQSVNEKKALMFCFVSRFSSYFIVFSCSGRGFWVSVSAKCNKIILTDTHPKKDLPCSFQNMYMRLGTCNLCTECCNGIYWFLAPLYTSKYIENVWVCRC